MNGTVAWMVMSLPCFLLADVNEMQPPDNMCGANCLFIALKALNVPINDVADLEKRLGQVGDKGYSFSQLSDCAKSYGLFCNGYDISINELEKWPDRFACIGLVTDKDVFHYINIYDIDKNHVHFIDYPHAKEMDRDAFSATWTGKVLLISDHPIEIPRTYRFAVPILFALSFLACLIGFTRLFLRFKSRSKVRDLPLLIIIFTIFINGCVKNKNDTTHTASVVPSLVTSPDVINFGSVEPGTEDSLHSVIRLSNKGLRDLKILRIYASCSCTVPQTTQAVIPPRRSIDLPISVKPGAKRGERTSTVSILSNDPKNKLANIQVAWFVRPLFFCDPDYIDLGKVKQGNIYKAQLKLSSVDADALDTTRITTSSDEIHVTPLENFSGLDGEYHVKLLDITVTPRVSSGPGDYRGNIQIFNCIIKKPILTSVFWHVSPDVYVTPAQIFLNNIKPNSQVKFAILTSLSYDTFKNLNIKRIILNHNNESSEVDFECSISEKFPLNYMLDISFLSAATSGVFNYTIELAFEKNGEPTALKGEPTALKILTVPCTLRVK